MLFYCKLNNLKPAMLINKAPLLEKQFYNLMLKNPSLQLIYAVPSNQTKIKHNIIFLAFGDADENWYENLVAEFTPINVIKTYDYIFTNFLNLMSYKKINFNEQFCYWTSQLIVGDLLDLLAHLKLEIPHHWNNLEIFHNRYIYDNTAMGEFNLNAWAKFTLEKKCKKDFREIFILDKEVSGFGFKER